MNSELLKLLKLHSQQQKKNQEEKIQHQQRDDAYSFAKMVADKQRDEHLTCANAH